MKLPWLLVFEKNKNSQHLDLGYKEIRAEGAGHIADALKSNTTITSIDLKYNSIEDEGAKHIANTIKSNNTITSIDLRRNSIRDEGAKYIANAIKSNTTITSIDLRRNSIGDEGAKYIAGALKSNNTITSIDLEYNSIRVEGAKYIADALKSNNTITSIDLRRNSIGDKGAKYIAGALKSNTTVTYIDLEYSSIGDEGAKYIANAIKSNTPIISIDLEWNTIGNEGAKYIADALKSNATITSINLEYNSIGDEGAKYIANALKSNITITSINLDGNSIGDEGVKYIADALKSNISLQTISIDDLVRHCQTWKDVANDISCMNLSTYSVEKAFFSPDGWKYIADSLKSNTTITSIDLRRNSIGNEGVKYIADALKSNTTITSIDLRRNSIGNEGIKYIADALKSNTTITSINLDSNPIGDEGTKYIADALRTNEKNNKDVENSLEESENINLRQNLNKFYIPQQISNKATKKNLKELLHSAHISSSSYLITMKGSAEQFINAVCNTVPEEKGDKGSDKEKKYPNMPLQNNIIQNAINAIHDDNINELQSLVTNHGGLLFQQIPNIQTSLPIYSLTKGKIQCSRFLLEKIFTCNDSNQLKIQTNWILLAKQIAITQNLETLELLHSFVGFTPLELIEIGSCTSITTDSLQFLLKSFLSQTKQEEKEFATFIFARFIPIDNAILLIDQFSKEIQITIAMNAAAQGNKKVLDRIMKLPDFDKNCKDFLGNTMLHYAVRFNRKSLARWLFKEGADDEIKNHYNQTALELSKLYGIEGILYPVPKLDAKDILFEKEKEIAETNISIVYKGKYKQLPVAIKKFKQSASALRDIRMHKVIGGPGIVEVTGWYELEITTSGIGLTKKETWNCLITRLYDKSLYDHLLNSKEKYPLEDQQLKQLVQNMTIGIQSIHKNGYIHLDLKPQNVFIYFDNTKNLYRAVVADIGSVKDDFNSLQTTITQDNTSLNGITKLFTCPEILNSLKNYAGLAVDKELLIPACDIYSFGIIILMMLDSRMLDRNFLHKNVRYIRKNGVLYKDFNEKEIAKTPFTKTLVEIIKKCIKTNPKERIAMEEILSLINK